MSKLDTTDYTLPRVKLSLGNTTILDIENPFAASNNKKKSSSSAERTASELVTTARNVFGIDRTRSLKFRKHQLKQLKRLYEENEDAMMEVLRQDLGKSRQEAAIFETEFVKNDLLNVLYNIDAWVKPEARYKRFMNTFDTLQVYQDPYGVVLIVGAWNFPIRSCLSPLAGAIAAGNCVIITPHEDASSTAKFLAEMIPKYLDTDCYQVFPGNRFQVEELLKERFDYIFCTGQYNFAKKVHEAAAKHLTPTTMVLGGKNPIYLDNSCDMELATKRILWGKCMNAGQTCAGVEYILCTEQVQGQFVKLAGKILEQFYGTDVESSPDFGRLITEQHYQRSVELLKGQSIALGGTTNPKTRFIHPTIITDVSPNDVIMQEDILAPILPIVTVQNLEEAVTFINARDKPLALYIFSKNKKDVEYLLKHTSSGSACVNDTLMQLGAESLPFGGVGNSGMGAYNGKDSFDTFVHKKSVLKKSFNGLVEMIECVKYPPYSDFKLLYLKLAMQRRRRMGTGWIPFVVLFILGFVIAFAGQFLYKYYIEKDNN